MSRWLILFVFLTSVVALSLVILSGSPSEGEWQPSFSVEWGGLSKTGRGEDTASFAFLLSPKATQAHWQNKQSREETPLSRSEAGWLLGHG